MIDIKKYTVEEPYLKIDCALGEGPLYDEATNTLRFVDVIKQQVHAIDLTVGPSSLKSIDLDISIGVLRPIQGDANRLVFGGKHGYGVLDLATGKYKYIKKVWTDEEIADRKDYRMRGNDGGIDSKGRFWLGFMNDPVIVKDLQPEGALFRLDPDLSLHRILEDVTIPNGGSWSADEKLFYWTDSPTGNIYVFDYDAETGSISNQRVFLHIDQEDCVPDGHCWDEEGYMWTAVHGMGKVLRVSPDGQIVAEISLPTRCITCPGFVGEDLFITSMGDDIEKHPESAKYMGSLFRCHVGVKGRKPNVFKPQVEL